MLEATLPQRLSFGRLDGATSGALRWLSPILLGLCAPMVIGLLVFPSLIEHARFGLMVILVAVLVIAVAAYAFSVLNPAPITGLVFDRDARTVTMKQVGSLATSMTIIGFDDIADLRLAQGYDDDGYPLVVPELKTRKGETFRIEAEITSVEIEAARRILGFPTARADTRRR